VYPSGDGRLALVLDLTETAPFRVVRLEVSTNAVMDTSLRVRRRHESWPEASGRFFIAPATRSNACSAGIRISAASQRATTNSQPTSLQPSTSQRQCVLLVISPSLTYRSLCGYDTLRGRPFLARCITKGSISLSISILFIALHITS
jgi:hypothetical protein